MVKPKKTKSKDSFPLYLFHQGTNYKAYEYLGAHPCRKDEEDGYVFRVWAPNAVSVSVVGDFNDWDPDANPMTLLEDHAVWECMIFGLKQYDLYKFCVKTKDGRALMKADPYAFHAETPPETASKLYDIEGYEWDDGAWFASRQGFNPYRSPVNIYEMHLGSWRRYPDGNTYDYRRTADELVEYLGDMGYNFVELMPVMEHPYDGSWGYQVTSYFAPTSRYGTPHDFMYFVDRCHQAGIGVIMDWVPAHFPKDAHGLYEFDGQPLYEYQDVHKREHAHWGTRIFDFGRNEVVSFLASSAMFWVEKYHIDGIRVDAVASMLYLDYGREDWEWLPNVNGGRENLEGGLGFNFKWNMGWMNDMIAYTSLDPIFRSYNHDKLTFSLFYAFSENFILPISHDEVVHGKCSLINKMPGDYAMKFSGMRTFLAYMMTHPGKKLLFMGQEFGQFTEWNETKSLDWMLLGYDKHTELQTYVKTLNKFYKDHPAFWQIDYSQSVVAFLRKDANGKQILVVCNFNPVLREGYTLGAPNSGTYKEILNSDDEAFGGAGTVHNKAVRSKKKPLHGFEQSITITLPPMSVLYFEVPAKRTRKTAEEKAAEKAAPKKASKTAKAEKAEEKAPAKRGRKPKAEAAPAEEKAPAKRGRKPKEEAAPAEEKAPAKPRAKKADKAEK